MKRRFRKKLRWLDGDLDPFLPCQVFDKLPFRKPSSGEERLAWRLLERCVLDACRGEQKQRLDYIDEQEAWIKRPEKEGDFSWSLFCGLLGVEERWMRDQFLAFLAKQRENAQNGVDGDFSILRKIEAVRIEQPHTLSAIFIDGHPYRAGFDGQGEQLYKCLSCGHTGDMSHFEGYTCVRGQPQTAGALKGIKAAIYDPANDPEGAALADAYIATDALKQSSERGDSALSSQPLAVTETKRDRAERRSRVLNEKSNSQSLNASHECPVRDQGSGPDHELDDGAGEGGCSDGGRGGSSSGVGAVATGAATTGSSGDLS